MAKEPTKAAKTVPSNQKGKKVDFNKVDVYLFDVKEGIDSIPTTGGIPLGKKLKSLI